MRTPRSCCRTRDADSPPCFGRRVSDLHQKFRDQHREYSPEPSRPFYGYVTTAIVRCMFRCCVSAADVVCRTQRRRRRRSLQVSPALSLRLLLWTLTLFPQSVTASCDTTSTARISFNVLPGCVPALSRRHTPSCYPRTHTHSTFSAHMHASGARPPHVTIYYLRWISVYL